MFYQSFGDVGCFVDDTAEFLSAMDESYGGLWCRAVPFGRVLKPLPESVRNDELVFIYLYIGNRQGK
ncbi:MAG: hypothetical protein R3293_21305 [Candidatus Promineifilaceae bacterium]|nr:hypothetical protein [Candidatus Promineifilaceae bacterium]